MAMSPLWSYAKNERETFVEIVIRGGDHTTRYVKDADLYRGARYLFPRSTLRDIAVNGDGTHVTVDFTTRRFHLHGTGLHDLPKHILEPYHVKISHGGSDDDGVASRITRLEAEPSRPAEGIVAGRGNGDAAIEICRPEKQANGDSILVRRSLPFACLQSINVNLRGTLLILEFPSIRVTAEGVRLTNIARRILNGVSIGINVGKNTWPKARSDAEVFSLTIDDVEHGWRFDEAGVLEC